MSEEQAYWTHELANFLSVSDGTLRKWCLELEKQGYTFVKGDNNSRAFLVRDRDFLVQIKHHIRTGNLTIENAVSEALQEFRTNETVSTNEGRSSELEVVRGSFESGLKSLNERMEKQEKFNEKLLERLDQRDKNLMAVLKELQTSKKEMLEVKRKKWWKFWNRD